VRSFTGFSKKHTAVVVDVHPMVLQLNSEKYPPVAERSTTAKLRPNTVRLAPPVSAALPRSLLVTTGASKVKRTRFVPTPALTEMSMSAMPPTYGAPPHCAVVADDQLEV
jgi:hypothetical protein